MITRRTDREVILIGEERILDETPTHRSGTPAESRLNAAGKGRCDAPPSAGYGLGAPAASSVEEPASPAVDLVALVTSRWEEAEAKAQVRAQEDRRVQGRELEEAKTSLADMIEARHAASERELKGVLGQLEERAEEVSRRTVSEGDRHANQLAVELGERGEAIERKLDARHAVSEHELKAALALLQERAEKISRRAQSETSRYAKESADELDERASATVQRLEDAVASYAADLLARHESLGALTSKERTRTLEELELRFDAWAADAEERWDAALMKATAKARSAAPQKITSAGPTVRASASNARSRHAAVAGGLALVASAVLILNVSNSSDPTASREVGAGADERRVEASKTRESTLRGREPQRDQASRKREQSSAQASGDAPVAEVEAPISPAPTPSSAPTAPESAPAPSEPVASEPTPEPASEADVQQEFGP